MKEIIQNSSRNISVKLLFLLFISNSLTLCQSKHKDVPLSDLTYLYNTLATNHPKLATIEERAFFDSMYVKTSSDFHNLTRTEAILSMMKFVASINDGHTSIARIWDKNTQFRRLPFRLYMFSNGIHISRIDSMYKNFAGMKLVKIGNKKIDDIIEKARPYIHGDNEMAFKNVLPNRLSQYDFLIGLKLGNNDSSISFVLEDSSGKSHDLLIPESSLSESYNMISARGQEVKTPLYLTYNGNYWHQYLEKEKLMYFQFNEVSDMDDKPFKSYMEELFVSANKLEVEKFVIDIRNNNGGDNTILKPLIHELIRSEKINKKGHLFTVIGRLTFSAAVSLATELEKHTETIFVGEPTSAPPNHFGETQLGELPSSKIKFLYSSQFWQGSFPWDDRIWVEPSIKTEFSADDYINGRDPSLAKIIGLPIPSN